MLDGSFSKLQKMDFLGGTIGIQPRIKIGRIHRVSMIKRDGFCPGKQSLHGILTIDIFGLM